MEDATKKLMEKVDDAVDRLNFIRTYLKPIGDLAYTADDEFDIRAAGAVMVMAADMIEKISDELDDALFSKKCYDDGSMKGAE